MGKIHASNTVRPSAMIDTIILHGGALGDLVLALQLTLRLPWVGVESVLRVISRADPGDLSECRPSVRRVSPEGLGLQWLHVDAEDPPPQRLRELIARRRILNALSGVESMVHRRLVALGAAAVYSFDPRPKPGGQTHITTQWQRELERQGLLLAKCASQGRDRHALAVPDEVRQRGWALFKKVNESWLLTAGEDAGRYISCSTPILIHPGSGGQAKCWALRRFLGVGRWLRQEGHDVCFAVGPVEAERWPVVEFDAIRSEFPLLECPGPGELLRAVAAARVLISNDAGPAHLASLLGTPTVTVFGPTSAAVWRPLGTGARVVQGDPQEHSDDWGLDPEHVGGLAGRTARG